MGYSCAWCDFRTRGSVEDLHAHMRGAHGIDIGRNRDESERRDFVHGNWHGRAEFRCNLCDRSDDTSGGRKFDSAEALNQHIKAKHRQWEIMRR